MTTSEPDFWMMRLFTSCTPGSTRPSRYRLGAGFLVQGADLTDVMEKILMGMRLDTRARAETLHVGALAVVRKQMRAGYLWVNRCYSGSPRRVNVVTGRWLVCSG